MHNFIFEHSDSVLPTLSNLRRYARHLVRQMGYELVGEGSSWQDLLKYRLFKWKLPDVILEGKQDPYFTPFKVDINTITSRVGFSFSEDGWHPFVQTLKEYVQDPNLRYEDSTLARLYNQYCPTNVQEVLLEHITTPLKPICDWPPRYELVSFIWALNYYSVQKYLHRSKSESSSCGWIFFGPHTQEYGKKEFQRLISVYNSIKNNGYQSGLTRVDPVNGYFLKEGNNFRFVLLQGNHRVSSLKVLGCSHVDVLIRQSHPAVIERDDLHRWTTTGGGIFPNSVIELLFDVLLNESGLQKAQRLGLVK